ncbi:hypothetical protein [Streptomyces goshikiensis]
MLGPVLAVRAHGRHRLVPVSGHPHTSGVRELVAATRVRTTA